MNRSFFTTLALLSVLVCSTIVWAQATGVRLIGISGNQGVANDETLYEINLTNYALSPLLPLPFIPDTDSIGFNPDSGLLHRLSGSEAYSDNPGSNGFRDNQFMETVDVLSGSLAQVAIFNANSQQFGPAAPRPTWVLPATRRTDDQTDGSFRVRGPNEYHGLRDTAWSSTEHLFYGADEAGIFKLTATGDSTFVGFPSGGIAGGPKGISFFNIGDQRRLLISERDGPLLITLDPMTAQPIGDPVVVADPNNPLVPVAGILGLAEQPDGSRLLGIAKGPSAFTRQLISIDPVTGDSMLLTNLDVHLAGIKFVYSVGPVIHNWNVDANGNWSTGSNWTNGEPNGVGVSAGFLGVITAPRTVTVDGAKTVGAITFDNANSYTLSGAGPLTLDNGTTAATILVRNGNHTIATPLAIPAGKTLIIDGVGSLTISGAQTHGAGAMLVANGSTTNLNSDGGQNLKVQVAATINFGSTQHLASLDLGAAATATLTAGGPKNLVTKELIVGGGTPATGKLDITNNAAIVDYPAAGPNPAATIRQQIITGRGGIGLGKPWNGKGITSSTAAADVVNSPNSRSIGYAVNADLPLGVKLTFRGETVDPSSVLIRYTRTGDANLDGVVNDDDVTIIGTFYAPGVAKPEWAKGDFDFNGFVDDDDVTLLGVFYNPAATPIPSPASGDASGGGAVAAVPEPATVVLFGMMAISLAGVAAFRRRVA